MEAFWIILGILAGALVLVLAIAFVCYMKVFYSPSRKPYGENDFPIPDGEIYDVHRAEITEAMKKLNTLPRRDVKITSHDGLTLRGYYYEQSPDAPIELMLHGYRGDSYRDMSVGVFRSFACGRNALVIDHRGSGRSDGHVITFGINESRDAERWIDFIIKEINPEAKIILTGISMGAATVMITSAKELPANVVGALADCGYTSAKDIIKKVVREMHLPPNILYPFIKLGARIYGGFDIDETSPIEAMKRCRVPIIFLHGDGDDFVPHSMSLQNYEACVAQKRMVTIDGAGHGLAYMVDPDKYLGEVIDFLGPIAG